MSSDPDTIVLILGQGHTAFVAVRRYVVPLSFRVYKIRLLDEIITEFSNFSHSTTQASWLILNVSKFIRNLDLLMEWRLFYYGLLLTQSVLRWVFFTGKVTEIDSSTYASSVTYELLIDKPTIVKYLLKFMVIMMPEEFRPQIQQKSQKPTQQGGDHEEFENLLALQMRRESSCRQRTLSVIKEEVEGADE